MKSSLFGPWAVVVLLWASGCRTEQKGTAASETRWIDPAKVEQGPVRHGELTADQLRRLRMLQAAFAEVDPTPLEKWVDDFKRDRDPDREIRIYEAMAQAYVAYGRGRNLSLSAKKDVYRVVLLRSGAPEAEVLKHLELKELSLADVKDVLRLYSDAPAPITVTPSAKP
jgi:hypothetical protein